MEFDHLVLGANTLSEGQEYVQDMLGVLVPMGGQHQRFGTHNAVMKLTNSGYLEIIATDPDAEPQHRPRWFSLDDPDALAQIASEPKLLTWVVNTGSEQISEILPELPMPKMGDAPNRAIDTPMQRGALRWNMLIPEAGRQSDLLFPWIIQWPEGTHPRDKMAELQCELLSIVGWHERPADFIQSLQRIQCAELLSVKDTSENAGKTRLEARLAGPHGEAVFCGLQENRAR